jgi:hypothetical protein
MTSAAVWQAEHVRLAQFLNQRDYCEILLLHNVLPGIMLAITDARRPVEDRRHLFDSWLARYHTTQRALSELLPLKMRFPVVETRTRR